MGLSLQSTIKVKEAFNEIFPGVKQKIIDEKSDGSAEAITVTVERIDRFAFLSIAEVMEQVGNSFIVKRSGEKITLGFY